ncbi:MAG: hypothetical protein ABJB76_01465 [Candidatus Nitrosocosmicus sp.]
MSIKYCCISLQDIKIIKIKYRNHRAGMCNSICNNDKNIQTRYLMMTINSKIFNKKVLMPIIIAAVAFSLIIWGLPQAKAAALNQTTNSAAAGYTQLPKITGSVHAEQTVENVIKDNLKVSFLQASEIAAKQITNSTIVGGHLEVVQGYLVYTFFVVNAQDQTGHMIIVDAGYPKVLYASQGQPIGSFSLQLLLMARM